MLTPEQIALDNCASEPVHTPGRVQSFGFLLAADREHLLVNHASANTPTLGIGHARNLLGKPLADALQAPGLMHEIRGALGLPSIHLQRERLGTYQFDGNDYECAVVQTAEQVIVEIEAQPIQLVRPTAPLNRIRVLLAGLPHTGSLAQLLNAAVTGLRALTGFDRVMAYRFVENGDGEVAAEAVSPALAPFLGMRYPASDIPAQVRSLMLRMPVRIIGAVDDPHVALISHADAPPLDLGLTHLRGVSPIHAEYLTNMGVGATINIAIMVRGELWGMFALHHQRPLLPNADTRTTCELFSQLISLQIQLRVDTEISNRREQVRASMAQLRITANHNPNALVEAHGTQMIAAAQAHGMAIVLGEHCTRAGTTPPEGAIHQICQVAAEEDLVTTALPTLTQALAATDTGNTFGVVCLPLTSTANAWILFFRDELLTQIRWAGNAEKQLTFGPNGPRLHPRASFDEYCTSVQGQSATWTPEDMTAAMEVRRTVLETGFDSAQSQEAAVRKERLRMDLVIAELNHRVKNIIALVRSIARISQHSAKSLEQFVSSYEKRLTALADAHSLVSANPLQWVALREMLQIELRPYTHRDRPLTLEGPEVVVRADVAPSLALVLHEMVSNAVKYGGLSSHGLGLTVSWKHSGAELNLCWQERSSQTPARSRLDGFGLVLLERAVPLEFQGTATVQFANTGLCVDIWIPAQTVQLRSAKPLNATNTSAEVANTASAPPAAVPKANGSNHILIVEDVSLLALELETHLRELGHSQTCVCTSLTDARNVIHSALPQLALLDINIALDTTLELALELVTAGVAVIFMSGSEPPRDLQKSLRQVPWLAKPIDRGLLERALTEVLS